MQCHNNEWFTKRIPGLSNFSYSERLEKLNLQSLEHRRLLTDLTTCYNIVHGYSRIVFDDFFSFIPNQFNTRGNSLRLTTPLDKTNIRKYFFSSRIIKPWNSLPDEIVTTANSKLFKSLISKQDFKKYLNFPCLICNWIHQVVIN